MIKMKKIRNSNEAVAGMVATFLTVGLIVTVISMVQMVYIPKWMEQAEADHMEVVADQFSQLKFAIDTQSVIKQPDTPISTSITLGNKELPFLMSSRAYGSLEILSDDCAINITNATGYSISYSLGVIKYSSDNAYYLDQTYIYEAGGVILSQSQGNTMLIKPPFSIKQCGYTTNISFPIINVSIIGNKGTVAGYGAYPIQTEFLDNPSFSSSLICDVTEISIKTNYPNAWHIFMNNTIINSGLEYDKNFSITTDESTATIQFNDPSSVCINLKPTDIGAQIAPGWIVNVKGIS